MYAEIVLRDTPQEPIALGIFGVNLTLIANLDRFRATKNLLTVT